MTTSEASPTDIERGLLDTSVVIDLDEIEPARLPREAAVSTLTLAELAAGPHAIDDPAERARRQERLQRAEAAFDPLPFDDQAARAYGRIYASTRTSARKPRGARAIDLLIAAVALANDLPLFTRNATDFDHLEDTGLQVHPV
jgi:predicted nucleic acid-binding protein